MEIDGDQDAARLAELEIHLIAITPDILLYLYLVTPFSPSLEPVPRHRVL